MKEIFIDMILSVLAITIVIIIISFASASIYKSLNNQTDKNICYQTTDVNRDGVVDIKDLLLVQKEILKDNKQNT